jgi:hypothetical protein
VAYCFSIRLLSVPIDSDINYMFPCLLCFFHPTTTTSTTCTTQFGSPEQVAARVVTAEVNRDGIFEVTVVKDPYQSNDGGYILEYLSVGKRGNKHVINKILIANNLLYVLTAQAKEDAFSESKELQEEMMRSVHSFRV